MPIPKVQVIKNSAPMPELSRTFMQTLRNESNDTEKHEKFIKTQYHLNSLEQTFLFANAVMTFFQRWQQSRGKLVRFEVRCTHLDTIQINESLEDSSESLEPY